MRATVNGAHLQQAGQVHRKDPVAVVHDGGLLGVQDLHGLAHVGLGVGLDLLLRKLRAGGVLARGVADQRSAVADDKGDVVAQVLELTHLAQGHGMAQVQVGAGGIDAELDVEGSPFSSFLRRSASGTICAAPEVMIRICSSTDSIGYPPLL